MSDDIKAAEQRGYAKGYTAGQRRLQKTITREEQQREQQQFLDRAFFAILPAAMNAQGWKFGDKPITSTKDRVTLAAHWAEEALRQRPRA